MPKLSPEDQARVDNELSTGFYDVDRPPFKLWRLMSFLVGFLLFISLLSYVLAWAYDIV